MKRKLKLRLRLCAARIQLLWFRSMRKFYTIWLLLVTSTSVHLRLFRIGLWLVPWTAFAFAVANPYLLPIGLVLVAGFYYLGRLDQARAVFQTEVIQHARHSGDHPDLVAIELKHRVRDLAKRAG